MKKLLLFLVALLVTSSVIGQVANYTFSQSVGTYSAISGGTAITPSGTTYFDDNSYGSLNIGFNFNWRGTVFTQFGLNENGFISMGATAPSSSYTSISSGSSNDVIAGFNYDLYGLVANGAEIRYQTLGTAPNRILVVQFKNFGFYSAGLADFNFQFQLYETTNVVNIVYGTYAGTSISNSLQVGLRGASSADFNNRTTTSNWSATTAGGTNAATCSYTPPGVMPASGLTFTWTPPPLPPAIVYTALSNTASLAPRTLTANITSLSGIPISGIGLPVLYWKKNAGTYSSAQGVSIGSNNYTFTFGSGVVAGDIISYYICAQDMAGTPIVGCAPSAGATGLTYNPPAAATPPTTPSSYTILNGYLCGNYNVGVGQTYATITAAIADLSLKEVNCPVTFTLTDNTYAAETFPIIVYPFAGASSTNTVTIKAGAGKTPLISGTSTSGIIVLYGVDYFILDGSNSGGTDKSTTWENISTSSMSYTIGVFYNPTTSHGTSNCTIKNNLIRASSQVTTSTYAIILNYSGGGYNNIVINNNTIYSARYGMQFCGVAGNISSNGQITNNIFGSTVDAQAIQYRGMVVTYVDNTLIQGNEIMGASLGNSNYSQYGLILSTACTNTKVRQNSIHDWYYNGTGGWGNYGLYFSTGDATTPTEISNNLLYNIKGDGFSAGVSSLNVAGMYFGSGGNVKLYHNSINLTGNVTSATYANYSSCVTISSGSLFDIQDNIFRNALQPVSGAPASKTFAIMNGGTASMFTTINYNDYWADGYSPNVGYQGAAQPALTDWQTATTQDANSLSINPSFVSATDLHPTSAGLMKAGTYLVTVPVDFSNNGRTNPPDIGAYQFSANPVVTTTAATVITLISATLNGTINASSATVTSGFEYGLTVAYGSSVAGVPATITGTTVTAMSAAITGLTPCTLYHYRAKGTSGGLTVYGNDMTFTTANGTPLASTFAATVVTATTATLNGFMNANLVSTTVTFDYGLTTSYGTTVPGIPSPVTGNAPIAVFANITGLLPGTTYHFRVFGANACGTNDGGDLTFTTPALAPTVVTTAASGVSQTAATLNGTVTANGASTTVTFEWGLTAAYGNTVAGTPSPVTGNIATNVSAILSGLTINTIYHYRVNGVNSVGTVNGLDMTFTTVCPSADPAGPITGPGQACQGGTGYVYSVAPIAGATGYNWTLPVGGTITSGNNTNSITVSYAANASSGYVFVYGTAPCGNGSPSQLLVTLNPPASPTIAGPNSVCVNSVGKVYTTQSGMSTYIWTISAGGVITSGNGTNTITVNWVTAGAQTVCVNYNSVAGCPALAPVCYSVTVNPLPVPTISGPNPACSNYPGLVYSTQAGMTSYVWGISAGGTITAGQGTSSITVTWTGTGAQNVSVTYSNANGCTPSAPFVYPVTVNSGAAPTITGSTNLCVNSGYYTYTTQTGMTVYTWSVSSGGVIDYGSGTNMITVSWIASGPQWVSVNYINPSGCTSLTPAILNVTVNPLPGPAGSITGVSAVCGGTNGVAYSVPAITGALTYVWALPAGASIASGAGTNAITVDFAGNASSGVIIVTGNNLCGDGLSSPPFTVTVTPLPDAAGTITGPSSVCQGATGVVYTVPPINGATGYTWTLPTGVTGVSGSNSNSITVDFSSSAVSGNITVYGSNSCGNGTVSPNFAVTVNVIPATPVVTNTGTTLHSSASAGNQWYFEGTLITGATGQNYVATQDGHYWDIVTLSGCSSDTSNHVLILTTGINSHSSASINLYPVPNDGRFNASITTTSEETFSIKIFNNLGVKIYEETKVNVNGSLVKVIDLRPIPNGVYTVIFENSQNQVVRKIVVNK